METVRNAALPEHGGSAARRAGVLALLLVAYTFNFVDRQILGILAAPIQQDLALSDTQLGLLGGVAFALLYSTMAVPIAALADRTSRSSVIAVSLALWSGFTALCGLATSFWQLFLCRVGVGVGEAGGVAPSYAIISDLFPPHQRARALSIYSLGIPLGSGLGILFGGYVAQLVDWRAAFVAVGIAGLLFAPLFRLGVREPRRSGPRAPGPGLATVARMLAAKPSFWLLSFGAGFSSMLGYGLAFWLPTLMRRSFGLDLITTAQFFGLLLLVGGSVGVLAGGWIGDWLGRRDRAALARVPAAAFLLAVPLFAIGVLSSSPGVAFALFLVPQALAYMWLGPVLSAVQQLVPPESRSTAAACFLLINNLMGVGFGALVIGALSDALAPRLGDEALRASVLASLLFYAAAALLLWIAGPRLRRDCHD